MPQNSNKIEVLLETGKKRSFVNAAKWPGWCRGGMDEFSSLQTLFDYYPRYARALSFENLTLDAPSSVEDLVVMERHSESKSADWGVPDSVFPHDLLPVTRQDIEFFRLLLSACWKAFDATVEAAAGRELTRGPRGGGRDLEKLTTHVYNVDGGYLKMLGGTPIPLEGMSSQETLWKSRHHMLDALEAAVRGELPTTGPRGGARWTPRYFVRRLAWHELDHAWEIEDRVI